MVRIVERKYDISSLERLEAKGFAKPLARVLASRGISNEIELETSVSELVPPEALLNCLKMAGYLADAIELGKSLLVIGDYDCDGATATAVAVRGLRSLGAKVDFLVPNRFEYGYGLTTEIVEIAGMKNPDVIITVDNGISSIDGVAKANELGIQVMITDHHLPGEEVPDALCIVNPNQQGCLFPSKNLAGVGVVFYVLLALRAEKRKRGMFIHSKEPNLSELLDLVALGTIADLVRLDKNNRILVENGLRRIRSARCCPGILALMRLSGRDFKRATAQDLGFSVGPRLNAAGRLDDMSLGISCLISDSETEVMLMARKLHELNFERRVIEADMQYCANVTLDNLDLSNRYTISIFNEDWHQGVIGILASRMKELYHRPVIAFARSGTGELKGSGRSINGLHLRDALDLVEKRHRGTILRFGGHAMAAGLSILENRLEEFNTAFEAIVSELVSQEDLEQIIEVDGMLNLEDLSWDTALTFESLVWGQGFPQPQFYDGFNVINQKVVGDKHLKLTLDKKGQAIDAILFNQTDKLPSKIKAVYHLQTNQFNGAKAIQLNIRHVEPA